MGLHVSDPGPIEQPLGVICRGGPINGPFSAGALLTGARILEERGIPIARLYANSGSTPSAALAAIRREDRTCSIWARLTPSDLVDTTPSWWSRMATVSRMVRSESIFLSTAMERLIREILPADELFASTAIPLSVMTVDYLSGETIVFETRNRAFYPVIHEGILGSMALTPFLRLQVIWCGPKGFSPKRQTPEDFSVALMDGGFRDNLLIDQACRDGMKTVLVIDIHGLEIAPPAKRSYRHWIDSLLRASHALIATNDQRSMLGATRVNEEIALRDELARIREQSGTPEWIRAALDDVLFRMNQGRLGLEQKRSVNVHLVSDYDASIPFDFASFTHAEVEHLISAGHRAMRKTLDALK